MIRIIIVEAFVRDRRDIGDEAQSILIELEIGAASGRERHLVTKRTASRQSVEDDDLPHRCDAVLAGPVEACSELIDGVLGKHGPKFIKAALKRASLIDHDGSSTPRCFLWATASA